MDQQGTFIASMISAASKAYAAGAVDRQLERQPDAPDRYVAGRYTSLADDTEIRLLCLAEALAAGRPALFDEEVRWLKVVLKSRDVATDVLDVNLECLGLELAERLPARIADVPAAYVASARKALADGPESLPSLLADGVPHADLARAYLLAALEGRRADAMRLVADAADSGVPVADLHEHVIGRTQAELGRMWQMAEIHVGEEHLGSRIAEEALALLRARHNAPADAPHTVLAACVSGGRHDVASRMLADQFELQGWRSILLGADVPSADLAHSARDFDVDLVALSAPLLLHVREAAAQIAALRREVSVPVLVGGRPFNAVDDLWRVVGADGYARTAAEGVAAGKRLVAAAGRG